MSRTREHEVHGMDLEYTGRSSTGNKLGNASVDDAIAIVRELKYRGDLDPGRFGRPTRERDKKDWRGLNQLILSLRQHLDAQKHAELLAYYISPKGFSVRLTFVSKEGALIRYYQDEPASDETLIQIIKLMYDKSNQLLKDFRWGPDFPPKPPPASKAPPKEASAPTVRNKVGTIYMLRAGKWYKIGKSTNSEKRLGQLAIQLPMKAELVHEIETNNIDSLEHHWHYYFGQKRVNGEWFELTDADVTEFKSYKRVELEN